MGGTPVVFTYLVLNWQERVGVRGGIHAEAGASRGGPQPLTTTSPEVRPRGQVGSWAIGCLNISLFI
jgi:hypothetical protein